MDFRPGRFGFQSLTEDDAAKPFDSDAITVRRDKKSAPNTPAMPFLSEIDMAMHKGLIDKVLSFCIGGPFQNGTSIGWSIR